MDVTLLQDQELLTLELDLELVLRIEQDLISDLDRSDMGSDGHGLCPREPPRHLCRGRDEDAGARAALAFLLADLHEHPIEEHGDWLLVDAGGDLLACHKRPQWYDLVVVGSITLAEP